MKNTLNSPKTPRLLHYFTLVGLPSIMIVSILLGQWVRNLSVNNLLDIEEKNNNTLAQVLYQAVLPKSHDIPTSSDLSAPDNILSSLLRQEVNKILQDKLHASGIIKISIYNPKGIVIFSSDPALIGKSSTTHAAFSAALQGKIISHFSLRDSSDSNNDAPKNIDTIMSYVPVKRSGVNAVEAVFKVYKDVTPVLQQIEASRNKMILLALGALGPLFLILFFFLQRSHKLIQIHSNGLHNSVAKIPATAYYDSLTGLPNRNLFMDRLQHAMKMALRQNKLIVLLFLDLDRFKLINDSLGHVIGDELLCKVAERISSCVRACDTVARLAGDEFSIILENVNNIDMATNITQRIIAKLTLPYQLEAHEVITTCSIGAAIFPFNDDNAESLLKKADAAMHYSKLHGQNQYHFYNPKMQQQGDSRLDIEMDLHKAIENNEFRIYFQPKVNLSDWTMHAMEALIRWEHPVKGLIAPGEFISILEETGMIIQVGEWVLHKSCMLNKMWQDEGLPPLRIAVNVSALQFRQPGFVETVYKILDDSGLDPQYLELELTESCLIEDIDESIVVLSRLKEAGIHITIDDFGTGYSSLSYLCKLPIDTLKIDRSFVKDLTINRENRSVITAIISFAHGLKKQIVAEGIETADQLVFLNAMRCSIAQGFLFSYPIPEQEFVELYRNGGRFGYLLDSLRLNQKVGS